MAECEIRGVEQMGIYHECKMMKPNLIIPRLETRAIYYTVMIAEKTEMKDRTGVLLYKTKLELVKDIIIDIYSNRPFPTVYTDKMKEYGYNGSD